MLVFWGFAICRPPFKKIFEEENLRKFYTQIPDGKKYLSPLHGLVWVESGLIEKFYRFGPDAINEGLDKKGRPIEIFGRGDKTIELVWKLFHGLPLSVGRDFFPTRNAFDIAYYLSANDIGTIFKVIEEKRNELAANDLRVVFEAAVDRFVSAKRSEIAAAEALLNDSFWDIHARVTASSMNWGTTIKNPEKDRVLSLFSVPEDIIPGAQPDRKVFGSFLNKFQSQFAKGLVKAAVNKVDGLAKTVSEIIEKNTKLKALEEIVKPANLPPVEAYDELADIVIDALKESGNLDGGDVKYPRYTPHFILLAFLYEKSNEITDIDAYIRSLTALFPGHQENVTGVDRTLLDEYPVDIQNYLKVRRPEYIPQRVINLQALRRPTNVGQSTHYSDCVEAAMFEFFSLVMSKFGAYDAATGLFDISKIDQIRERIPEENRVANWAGNNKMAVVFEAFNRAHGNVNNQDARQVWVDTVSQLIGHGLTYNNGQDHELIALPSNYVALFNYFFGSTFTGIADLFAFLGITYDGTDNPTGPIHALADINDVNALEKTTIVQCAWDLAQGKKINIDIQFGGKHGEVWVKPVEMPSTGFLNKIKAVFNSDLTSRVSNFAYVDYNLLSFGDELNILGAIVLEDMAFNAQLSAGKFFRLAISSFNASRICSLIKFLQKTEKLNLTDSFVSRLLTLLGEEKLASLLKQLAQDASEYQDLAALSFANIVKQIIGAPGTFAPIVVKIKPLAREFLGYEFVKGFREERTRNGRTFNILCDELTPLVAEVSVD